METPDAGQNIITRGLPKTGQVTMYRMGDDARYEAGWWQGRSNVGNRERWITKRIALYYIIVDRATGLMWAKDGNGVGCGNGGIFTWNDAIDYANGLTFANFSDWRLPNFKELSSIVEHIGMAPFIPEPPFSNTISDNYWSSTTDPLVTTRALIVRFDIGIGTLALKTSSYYIRAVRGGM